MTTTRHLDAANPADIAHAAEILRAGGTVAFATETVYGLGANAFSPNAIAKIFTAKQRPAWDPLIVHIGSLDALADVAIVPPELQSRIRNLAAAFWPGPLTLLLPRREAIPDAVTAGRPLVGVRIPSHPVALALLTTVQLPIAAPSANTFGHTSPTTAAHVLDDLNGRIDAVLDAGPTTVGVESTVLDPTQTPMVLYRPGAITPEQIAEATGIEVHTYIPSPTHRQESLPAPGVGLRHYAPRARLILVEPAVDRSLNGKLFTQALDHLQNGARVGVMLPKGWLAPPEAQTFPWGEWVSLETLARNLFAGLRTLDDQRVDIILCPLPPPTGLADAIRDRLHKAARPV